MSGNKHTYASAATLRRAIKTIEGAGVGVGSVKLYPDGSIELACSSSAPKSTPANDFDRLEELGQL